MNLKSTGLLVAVALGTALLTSCTASTPHTAPATTSTPTAASIAAAAQQYLAGLVASQQFDGTVLLAVHGKVVFRSGFGTADTTTNTPDTVTTRYRIGSQTKAFTALAIVQLQQQGHLKVSDLVCHYITDCPAAWQPITLQELLTHSSGIYDYLNDGPFDWSQPHTSDQVVALAATKPVNFPPGTAWRYSNTGYVLLGMVIEKVTGQPYTDYVRTHILAPLGMTASDFYTTTNPGPNLALGYHQSGTLAPTVNQGTVYSDGALASDIDDLYRWDTALLSGRSPVATSAMLTQIFHPWVPMFDGGPTVTRYGYGWFIEPAQHEYHHSGGLPGYLSENILLPQSQFVVIVLSNLDTSTPDDIAEHLAKLAGLTVII
jgi:CubicO group peptidase (beta-lactamase class C family)